MSFFNANALSPKQIERRERIRMKGRNHYIIFRGILGWGMPVFLLTTLWRWHDHGWHLPLRGELYFETFLGLIIWTAAGYWVGAQMWQKVFEEPARKA
jgi:hypothetical protein